MTDLITGTFESRSERADIRSRPTIIVTDDDFEATISGNCNGVCNASECEERKEHE